MTSRNVVGLGHAVRRSGVLLAVLFVLVAGWAAHAAWKPAAGPLLTRWAKDVKPSKVHAEYPRPQMVRAKWQNLNGLWEYAIVAKAADRPAAWDGEILVPFPVESALSGVMKRVSENDRLWYRRTFKLPGSWKGQRLLLHFGAVDWETTVYVNGQEVGSHRGGYDAFWFDITDAVKAKGEQELVVAVWDPTDAGTQPRGKQVRNPRGIWYTPTSGIWQTVWLEPVAPAHIQSFRLTPDVDGGKVKVEVTVRAPAEELFLNVSIHDGRKQVNGVEVALAASGSGGLVTKAFDLPVAEAKLWSPDAPFLYGVKFGLRQAGEAVDRVESYVGMRKIAVAKDADGVNRLFLNNKPLFQFGPLDQGFWPDGLYTAPTDEALRYDIEMTKQLGFNMARKHVKIEPARWYYWCDKLGLLVWQDMPSGDKYIRRQDPDITRTPESAAQFEQELRALVDGFFNHPSIVMWVPYNEGWGQWETCRIVDQIREWDPTRLVNNASGWTDRECGDVNDIHSYPGPAAPPLEEKRAGVLGEFGGLGLPVKGHTWQDEKNWGYRSYKTPEELTDAYVALIRRLHPMTGAQGLAAAVYTQTTDVEIEVNGLMTYDRALVKMDAKLIAEVNERVYTPLEPRRSEGVQLVPPATPLVAHDPYFSIWSEGDRLTEVETTHWTGKPHRLTSLIRVDGKTYRLMGATPAWVPALEQTGLEVTPTRTIYRFAGAGIELAMNFITPALPDDLDILARPVTYLAWDMHSADGKRHDVALYLDASGEIAVNTPDQPVDGSVETMGELRAAKIGSRDQAILAKPGDDIRIDWGYFYMAAPQADARTIAFGGRAALQKGFVESGLGSVPASIEDAPATGGELCAAMAIPVGKISSQPVSRWVMLAYDDLYSIQYMKQNLRPYWRRDGWEAADLLQAAARDYEALVKRCVAFDEELRADLTRAGGEKFAKLCALAYRQCFAAGKFVADANGQPISFCKENHSNGCIGTSDVFYPMAPQFLLFGPSVAKSFLVPFMNYAASERWKFPFAPHDLGQYPHANGQRYGGGERSEENQMPVEESGNLLILMAAVAQMEGNADFASLYWPQLTQWAGYLKEKGYDPENQLCTDDFAGHMAHNVNLSAKAICGLGAYAKLCALRGETARAEEYATLAREFAGKWVQEANDGDHFRLAFDKPGTWSQKYNLMWDRILGLGLFPAEVLRKEMDYYKKIQNRYGLPLDNRSTYTKLDWILWTATLTQERADFEALVDPVFRFLNETPDRSPMTDWYFTDTGRKRGFTARPVVGGVFAQMLYDRVVWSKYAGRDRTRAVNYAPMPKPPIVVTVVPTAQEEEVLWRYTTNKPADDWYQPGFNDGGWKTGPAGFGTRGTPGAVVRTEWNSPDIWLRREFTLPEGDWGNLSLNVHHDETVEIYLNGVRAASAGGFTTGYESMPINAAGRAALKPGKNVIAIRCHQTTGGQYIDAGFADVREAK